MNCAITSANNFSVKSVVISRIAPVQSAVSVRKPTLNRPFICPILVNITPPAKTSGTKCSESSATCCAVVPGFVMSTWHRCAHRRMYHVSKDAFS
jgi:hypothetical protein